MKRSEWRILKLGLEGEDVKSWQKVLIQKRYDLSPYGADGDYGETTKRATEEFQKDHNLTVDGVVGPKTISKIKTKKSSIIDEFIQAKNYRVANRNPEDIKWLVIHSMEAPEASTTADNVANWFASDNAPMASAHYNIDSSSIIQSVKEKDVAYHAPGANRYGIGLEHAGYARQSTREWLDPFSIQMLTKSAELAEDICSRLEIPLRFVNAKDLKKGKAGITTHYEVSEAFKKSDHTDPGCGFPIDLYLCLINNFK